MPNANTTLDRPEQATLALWPDPDATCDAARTWDHTIGVATALLVAMRNTTLNNLGLLNSPDDQDWKGLIACADLIRERCILHREIHVADAMMPRGQYEREQGPHFRDVSGGIYDNQSATFYTFGLASNLHHALLVVKASPLARDPLWYDWEGLEIGSFLLAERMKEHHELSKDAAVAELAELEEVMTKSGVAGYGAAVETRLREALHGAAK